MDTEPEVLPEVPESAHEDTTDQVLIGEANPPQQADPLEPASVKKSVLEDEGESETEGEESESDDNPLLFVDVNLGPDRAERIVVYDGDTAEGLAEQFSQKHNLSANMHGKLVQLLQNEISGLLARIDEEEMSDET